MRAHGTINRMHVWQAQFIKEAAEKRQNNNNSSANTYRTTVTGGGRFFNPRGGVVEETKHSTGHVTVVNVLRTEVKLVHNSMHTHALLLVCTVASHHLLHPNN